MKAAKKAVPGAAYREIRYVLRDSGKLTAYAGTSPGNDPSTLELWVERARQVWCDVRNGYRHLVRHDEQQVDVVELGHQRVAAPLPDGTDLLAGLPPAAQPHVDLSRLSMVETYHDLYLAMRGQ